MDTNIVIVGKGIAALVLAFLLKQKGHDYILVSRKTNAKVLDLAETLPPAAMPLLQQLGLLSLFEKHSIRKTYGYHSLWGSDRLTDHNFYFHHPFKYGLKINKKELTEELLDHHTASIYEYDGQFDIDISDEQIFLRFDSDGQAKTIKSNLIIDASGRSRVLLGKLGIENINQDHTLSFTCHLPKRKHPRLKHDVYVESFETGWGLISGLSDTLNVMSIFTHKKSPIFNEVKHFSNWPSILSDTTYLKYSLVEDFNAKITGKLSNSSRPHSIAGNNWLAIGDAALAFDPLCSHGISNAVYTAKRAVRVIEEKLSLSVDNAAETTTQELDPFYHYHKDLEEIFDAYLISKAALYGQERRWKDSAYWVGAH